MNNEADSITLSVRNSTAKFKHITRFRSLAYLAIWREQADSIAGRGIGGAGFSATRQALGLCD
ncbi:hypothetical protein CRENPOLYSF1_640027 [Crenothrix polyspora]|uniref:Uncharacterized protein n=1 Tax=Crenothrix polyspora TaxID=360316 RepID=A0A1R4HFY1_9GAMM|nr:hypothetical protein CRENPOLYSF1_640027 [Crenothrix polyspora]